MKFVHLAAQTNIDKIKKSGLHMRSGRRGRGVYAVPLIMLQREGGWNFEDKAADVSVDITSSTLWKWLVKRGRSNGRAVAVVFELPLRFWPIKTRLEVNSKFAKEFFDRLLASPPAECSIPYDSFDSIYSELEHHESADFDCEVHSPKGLGRLLHLYKASGARPWIRHDESIGLLSVNRYPLVA